MSFDSRELAHGVLSAFAEHGDTARAELRYQARLCHVRRAPKTERKQSVRRVDNTTRLWIQTCGLSIRQMLEKTGLAYGTIQRIRREGRRRVGAGRS